MIVVLHSTSFLFFYFFVVVLTVLLSCYIVDAVWNCCHLCAHSMNQYNHAPVSSVIQSRICSSGFFLLFFLVRAGLFECFHNPQNSCMDYKIIVSEEVVVYVVRMTWKWLRMGADLNNFFSFFSRLWSQLLVMRSHCRCTMTNIISVVLKYEMHLSLVENKCKLAPGKN